MISLDNLLVPNSMLSTTFLVVALTLASFSRASVLTVTPSPQHYKSTCRRIASAISNSSQVFYPSAWLSSCPSIGTRLKYKEDSTQYIADNEHAALSSTQASACSVEPGSAADVSLIVWSLPFIIAATHGVL